MEPTVDQRLAAIEQRNLRVEADKAWETSACRKLSIATVTYVVACAVLFLISTPNWAASALMPTLGYLLSTITLGKIRLWWVKKYQLLPSPGSAGGGSGRGHESK
jgi:hypothetical protein